MILALQDLVKSLNQLQELYIYKSRNLQTDALRKEGQDGFTKQDAVRNVPFRVCAVAAELTEFLGLDQKDSRERIAVYATLSP